MPTWKGGRHRMGWWRVKKRSCSGSCSGSLPILSLQGCSESVSFPGLHTRTQSTQEPCVILTLLFQYEERLVTSLHPAQSTHPNSCLDSQQGLKYSQALNRNHSSQNAVGFQKKLPRGSPKQPQGKPLWPNHCDQKVRHSWLFTVPYEIACFFVSEKSPAWAKFRIGCEFKKWVMNKSWRSYI